MQKLEFYFQKLSTGSQTLIINFLDYKKKKRDKWAIIIGPDGGFSDNERNIINKKNNSMSISLGPRIMRSDTAVVAILAIFQMIIGDWKS